MVKKYVFTVDNVFYEIFVKEKDGVSTYFFHDTSDSGAKLSGSGRLNFDGSACVEHVGGYYFNGFEGYDLWASVRNFFLGLGYTFDSVYECQGNTVSNHV